MKKFYDKILLRTEILYLDIIDDFVDKRKYKNRTDFINEAIKEKLEKEYGSLTPKENQKFEDWGWE